MSTTERATVDLTKCPDAESACKKLRDFLQENTNYHQCFVKHMKVLPPEEHRDAGWVLQWEEGPYEWPMALTGGVKLLDFAMEEYGGSGEPQIKGFTEANDWWAEPVNRHSLAFMNCEDTAGL